MKHLYLFLLILVTIFSLGQDIIFKTNGTTVNSKVIKVGTETIEYKNIDKPDGPSYEVSKNEVLRIVYKNGTVENLSTTAQNESTVFYENFNNPNSRTTITKGNMYNVQYLDSVVYFKMNNQTADQKLPRLVESDIVIPISTFQPTDEFSVEFDVKFEILETKSKSKLYSPVMAVSMRIGSDNAYSHSVDDLYLNYDYFAKQITCDADLGVTPQGIVNVKLDLGTNQKSDVVAKKLLYQSYPVQRSIDNAWNHIKLIKNKNGFAFYFNQQYIGGYTNNNMPLCYNKIEPIHIKEAINIAEGGYAQLEFDNILVKVKKPQ